MCKIMVEILTIYRHAFLFEIQIKQFRVLVRTGAAGACAPVNFEQRVPGTRQFWSYLGPGAGGLI